MHTDSKVGSSRRKPRGPLGAALFAVLATIAWLGAGSAPQAYSQAGPTATPVQRPGGRFEENDPLLVYSGAWAAVSDGRASGSAFRRASDEGASVQLTYSGPTSAG